MLADNAWCCTYYLCGLSIGEIVEYWLFVGSPEFNVVVKCVVPSFFEGIFDCTLTNVYSTFQI